MHHALQQIDLAKDIQWQLASAQYLTTRIAAMCTNLALRTDSTVLSRKRVGESKNIHTP